MKLKISLYMVTFNEEKRLERTLKAVCDLVDEIIIVDSGSKDKTRDIAVKYGAKFIYHEWVSYCDQKSFAEQQCKNDWVMMLDADEVISPQLFKEIKALPSKPEYMAYNFTLSNMFFDDIKPAPLAVSIKAVRLYNKNFAHMPPDLWNKDRVKVNEGYKIGKFKGVVYHYGILDITQATSKYNLHSTELQKTLKAENRSFSTLRLFCEFPFQFLRYYIGQRYFLSGSKGFVQAIVLAHFRFLKIAKWFEAQRMEKFIKGQK